MNVRVLIVALVCALLAAAGVVLLVINRPPPAGDTPAAAASAPGPASAPAAATGPVEPRAGSPRRAAAPSPAAPSDAPAAVPELGSLHVVSDVPGAQVFIDRQFVGRAPVTASDIAPGSHRLNVEAEGFEGVAQTIDVEPGPREIEVRLREVRLDASIAVVHRHRIGSCTGRLTATTQGLRYETTDRDDAFEAPLEGLETFQVDYAEKTLRVRLRGGRQYDFTDPEGDADRLFVFHRDVEKARARLARGDTPARD